jgi:hypothetical protein
MNDEKNTTAAAERVIGALAQDIRNDWSESVSTRIDIMETLAERFNVKMPVISDEDRDRACEDGRSNASS